MSVLYIFAKPLSKSSDVIFCAAETSPPKLPKPKRLPQVFVSPMLYAARANIFGRGVFTDKTGLKIFVFINAMIFAFTTFVKNTPLYGKIASKV